MTESVEIPTAPGLLRMDSIWAKVIVAVGSVVLAASVFGDVRGVVSLPMLGASVVLASLAMLGIVAVSTDPIPRGIAISIVALVISSCSLACLAVPHVPANANQTNALGAGVAAFAFLCVRGRTLLAWLGLAVALLVFGAWGQATDQGFLAGVLYAIPNVAVIGMSTLFAAIMRPAARGIGELRQRAVSESAALAATAARREERRSRQQTLWELAGPTLEAAAACTPFSVEQATVTGLLARRLRDSIRAPSLDVPAVVAAAAAARARGVRVVLFDDGGLDRASDALRQSFCDAVVEQLHAATDGSVTVRVAPAGRESVGSVVVSQANGSSHRIDMDPSGRIQMTRPVLQVPSSGDTEENPCLPAGLPVRKLSMSFEAERFVGDRYQRLEQGAEVLAADPSLAMAPEPFGIDGLTVFITACRRSRVLDGLSDDDSDLLALLLLIHFHFGLVHVLDCLDDVLAAETTVRQREGRPAVDEDALRRSVATALALVDEICGTAIPNEH